MKSYFEDWIDGFLQRKTLVDQLVANGYSYEAITEILEMYK